MTDQIPRDPVGLPAPTPPDAPGAAPLDDLIAARREKLRWFRESLGAEPYGSRVDGLVTLATARSLFDEAAHTEYESAVAEAKNAAKAGAPVATTTVDRRRQAKVAGRIVQHRDLGKLIFLWLRDHSGDLQISLSKATVGDELFTVAKKLDYGDIVVAEGPVGRTQKGEICVWAAGPSAISLATKSVVPPPEKWHGLTDPELRYRQRYVDLFANPETIRTAQLRCSMIAFIRQHLIARDYLEVETPMMQSVAGGAAARPFVTHHNALGMQLFMRVAPELFLKRLLVGGLPKVFEINRNFRNEGVDRSHNPEFTALEAYQAFGDCFTMLELTETLLSELAEHMAAEGAKHGVAAAERSPRGGPILPFGELRIDWSKPFERVTFGDLFERALGFPMTDRSSVRDAARSHHLKDTGMDHWLVVDELFEAVAEPLIDPNRPTFVLEYPSAISPLTRPNRTRPELADRWDLFIGGMEVGPAYTELNDPDIQLAKFSEQLTGEDDEARTFRSLDEDFIHALRVGMPPAGGLGLGIDRLAMLMTNSLTIRDVILFPLMRTRGSDAE